MATREELLERLGVSPEGKNTVPGGVFNHAHLLAEIIGVVHDDMKEQGVVKQNEKNKFLNIQNGLLKIQDALRNEKNPSDERLKELEEELNRLEKELFEFEEELLSSWSDFYDEPFTLQKAAGYLYEKKDREIFLNVDADMRAKHVKNQTPATKPQSPNLAVTATTTKRAASVTVSNANPAASTTRPATTTTTKRPASTANPAPSVTASTANPVAKSNIGSDIKRRAQAFEPISSPATPSITPDNVSPEIEGAVKELFNRVGEESPVSAARVRFDEFIEKNKEKMLAEMKERVEKRHGVENKEELEDTAASVKRDGNKPRAGG